MHKANKYDYMIEQVRRGNGRYLAQTDRLKSVLMAIGAGIVPFLQWYLRH